MQEVSVAIAFNKMIPNETKEKIFALYWGQKVAKHKASVNAPPVTVNNAVIILEKVYHLELKPLSEITDEEAKELGHENSIILNDWISIRGYGILNVKGIDYLRSLGYALPAFGYSVEQLIEEGVFKLITNPASK